MYGTINIPIAKFIRIFCSSCQKWFFGIYDCLNTPVNGRFRFINIYVFRTKKMLCFFAIQ
jgi:hypothetical protein